MTAPQPVPADPADIARHLHSLSGAIGEAARGIDHNSDLHGLASEDVDDWISDLERVWDVIEHDSREGGSDGQ